MDQKQKIILVDSDEPRRKLLVKIIEKQLPEKLKGNIDYLTFDSAEDLVSKSEELSSDDKCFVRAVFIVDLLDKYSGQHNKGTGLTPEAIKKSELKYTELVTKGWPENDFATASKVAQHLRETEFGSRPPMIRILSLLNPEYRPEMFEGFNRIRLEKLPVLKEGIKIALVDALIPATAKREPVAVMR